MNPALVHAPLAAWALSRAAEPALQSAACTLSFAQLQAAVLARSQRCQHLGQGAYVPVDARLPAVQRIADFLGIVASGRCAVVTDPDWPAPARAAVEHALAQLSQETFAGDAQADTTFYLGFTSGSSGVPKGYRRSHGSWTSSFQACVQAFGEAVRGRILAPGNDAHSLFLFAALLGVWSGGGVALQERFSAAASLAALQGGDIACLVMVPSQLLLLLQLARQRACAAIPTLRLVLISGAFWSRAHNAALRALFPEARIVEFYGASETSFIAWTESDESADANLVGQLFPGVQLRIQALPADPRQGLIFVRSPMLFQGYVGAANDDPSAALRDGDWLSVRDLGYLDAQQVLHLTGRQNRMLVTRGKNVFPEEVESALMAHPAIAQASVHALPDALRGARIAALLLPRPDTPLPSAQALRAWCRQRLDTVKTPRQFLTCTRWRQTPAGKTDHRALAALLQSWAVGEAPHGEACLNLLR